MYKTSKYWNNQGKYQKELKIISDKLIPTYGEASNENVELVRLTNRFFYDLYNNGLGNIEVFIDIFENYSKRLKEIDLSEKAQRCADLISSLVSEFKKSEDMDTKNYEEVDCSSCDGSGADEEGNTCEECDGIGFVFEDILSDQDEHLENVVYPIIDKISNNGEISDALIDEVLEYAMKEPIIAKEVNQ